MKKRFVKKKTEMYNFSMTTLTLQLSEEEKNSVKAKATAARKTIEELILEALGFEIN